MTAIHVCSLREAAGLANAIGAAAMVSILHPDQAIETPPGLDPAAHLRLVFDDVVAYDPRRVMPAASHVDALVALFGRWDAAAGPLLIHCTQGVSRSPAAALLALCWHNRGREVAMAAALRRAAPFAAPNRRFLEVAAEHLAWPTLLAAARAMGQPGRAMAASFGLPLHPAPDAAAEAGWGA